MARRQAVDAQASSDLLNMPASGAASKADGAARNSAGPSVSHRGMGLREWKEGRHSALIHCFSG